MHPSLLLARLIGPLFLAIGAGMLVNAQVYQAMADEFLRSHALIYLSGLLALLGGLAIVNTHNVWALEWRAIITVLGWLATFGGVVRIVVPQLVEAIGSEMVACTGVMVGAAIVIRMLGGFLSFKGYAK